MKSINRRNVIIISAASAVSLLMSGYLDIFSTKQKNKLSITYFYPEGKEYAQFLVDRTAWSSQAIINKIRKQYLSNNHIISINETKNIDHCCAEIIFKNNNLAQNFLEEIQRFGQFDKDKIKKLNYRLTVSIGST